MSAWVKKNLGKKPQSHGFGRMKKSWTYSSVETLWKLSELCQRVSERHVWMEAVEQNTDDCLGGTRVVNDLKTHNFHEKQPMEVSLQRSFSTAGPFTSAGVWSALWSSVYRAQRWNTDFIKSWHKPTCLAKKIWSSLESWTMEPAGSSPGCHLKRKIKPWTGLQQNRPIKPAG